MGRREKGCRFRKPFSLRTFSGGELSNSNKTGGLIFFFQRWPFNRTPKRRALPVFKTSISPPVRGVLIRGRRLVRPAPTRGDALSTGKHS